MGAHAAAGRADATSAGRRLPGTGGPRTASRCSRSSRGLGVHQRHDVLQLVAEAEGAARLVVAAARPQPAGQGLVQQPAVGQHVEGLVRASPPGPRPACGSSTARPPSRARRAASEPRKRCTSVPASSPSGVPPSAEPEDDLALLPVGQIEAAPGSRRRGPDRLPSLPDRWVRAIAAGLSRLPLRPMNSARSQVMVRFASSTSKNATRSGNSVL